MMKIDEYEKEAARIANKIVVLAVRSEMPFENTQEKIQSACKGMLHELTKNQEEIP